MMLNVLLGNLDNYFILAIGHKYTKEIIVGNVDLI